MPEQGAALHFDDVEIGDRWISPARTVTETDVGHFAELTGDFTPLHVDADFARQTPFGRPIAHGLLGLSLMAGLSSGCPRMQTAAFLGIRDWQFLRPIFFGDTVHVETEIVSKQASGRRRGRILWRRRLVNQDGEVVQQGELETLVMSRRPLTQVAPLAAGQNGAHKVSQATEA
ncbi:MAG: dehydratase [Planctomycetia bacterium]|nr:dehydratase [Planctomycetia bacterium]